MNLGSRLERYYHPHFTEEYIEAQRCEESCPRLPASLKMERWALFHICLSKSCLRILGHERSKESFEWCSTFWLLRNDSKAPSRASLLGCVKALMEGISQIGNRLFSLTTEKNPISRPDGKHPAVLTNPALLACSLTWIHLSTITSRGIHCWPHQGHAVWIWGHSVAHSGAECQSPSALPSGDSRLWGRIWNGGDVLIAGL